MCWVNHNGGPSRRRFICVKSVFRPTFPVVHDAPLKSTLIRFCVRPPPQQNAQLHRVRIGPYRNTLDRFRTTTKRRIHRMFSERLNVVCSNGAAWLGKNGCRPRRASEPSSMWLGCIKRGLSSVTRCLFVERDQFNLNEATDFGQSP